MFATRVKYRYTKINLTRRCDVIQNKTVKHLFAAEWVLPRVLIYLMTR
ncbi:hypothetical protein EAI_06872 [Harpegnathos saltator]|uniref:Uncharacterized protein n=1 Tax=Harpegnathos saltator TaxID=610380 RepID=E2B2D9_HARSA|nr:hypothetical protein EAI_06872 [Harpegnathos saltator]